MDEEGKPLERRITGYDLVPEWEKDLLTAMDIITVWEMSPEDVVNCLPASEFYRRAALIKAHKWSQPTPQSIAKSKESQRMRRR